jgi:tetratricopeptide (TPR) repeat protein
MRAKLIAANLALALAIAPYAFAQEPESEHHHHHDGADSLGRVHFPVSCAAAVEPTFNRGMALLYSFEYEASQEAFAKASAADPKCAMAKWGQAMSLYHQLWEPPSKENLQRGEKLLAAAAKLKAPTAREQEYISALTVFYTDTGKLDHEKRARAYSDAMRKVYEHNPQDQEAAVLYSLSLLASSPPNDTEHTNDRAAVAILSHLFDEQPAHPGIAHYIIHSCDNPSMAGLGLAAARKYASIAPASAHAVHMPSHIFARLGLWQDDIQSNMKAIEIANQMGGMHLHVLHHKIHSLDFLIYAYLQVGDDASAKAMLDDINAVKQSELDPEYTDYAESAQAGFAATYAIERRQWKDALALQPNPHASASYTQASIYWGRAIAAGHLHDAAAAEAALKAYDEILVATAKGSKPYIADYLKEERKVVQAWSLYASGKTEEATKLLDEHADRQDKVGKGETSIPSRELLADMLLESGKAQEALEQYEIALKTDPNRFNGLYGAARAAGQLQQNDKAALYYAQLLKNCSGSQSDRPELRQARMLVAAK